MPLNLPGPGPLVIFREVQSGNNWTLSLTDTTTSTDTLANRVGKSLGDTTTPVDLLANRVGKSIGDTTTSTDTLANRVGKSLSDSTTATDALAKRVGKQASDTTTSTDSFSRVVAYHVSLTDSTTSTDLASIGTSTVPAAPVTYNFGAFVDRGGQYERDHGKRIFSERYKRRG